MSLQLSLQLQSMTLLGLQLSPAKQTCCSSSSRLRQLKPLGQAQLPRKFDSQMGSQRGSLDRQPLTSCIEKPHLSQALVSGHSEEHLLTSCQLIKGKLRTESP